MKESMWQEKQKLYSRKFIAVLVGVTAIVVFICIQFIYRIEKTTAAETERYLSELSSSVVYSVDARLQANLDALESIALTYTERKKLGMEEDISYLQSKAEVHKFVSVFVMSPDGKAEGSDGVQHDFSKIPEIMDTLEGKSSVLNDALIYGETRNGFAYTVPIYEDNTITGALVACNSTEWIRSLLSQTYFEGNGFFHIINTEGAFIVKSDNPFAMEEKNNFFTGLQNGAEFNHDSSLEKLKEFVASNEKGTIYFTMKSDEIRKIGRVIPLSYPGYYLFLVVTEQAAGRQFNTLLLKSIVNNIIIALLFVSLVVILFLTHKRNSKQLAMLAFVDGVTGGYSKIRFEAEAEKLIHSAKAGKYTFVSLNVANFKLINDTFGTMDGDKVLKHIHDAASLFLKENEMICRSFSDHFDLLIHSNTNENLKALIGSMVQSINAFNKDSAKKYYLLLTAGIYQIDDPDISIVHIRDRANAARKSNRIGVGKELFVCGFYSDQDRQKQLKNKDLENKMNDALEQEAFAVYLQPKVRLKDKKIVGAEALVRWNDKEWGMIPPGDFIPFFEQNHFIVQLDLYVFEQVCRYIRRWLDADRVPVPVSVNLSRVHLEDQGFLQKFIRILQKYKIPEELLEMELTETVLAENVERVTEVVREIHQAGLSCSIDDFGSGYSSLNLLRNVDADTLKLDKAFFDSLDTQSPRERVIVESMVRMAEKLQMSTVAEGIETIEQMRFLEEIKCDMVQGYVFSKPVEVSIFEKMLFEDAESGL